MPSFLIPIIAFIVWLFTLSSYLPILRLDLAVSDSFLSAQFFISYLILVLALAFSGPVTAAVLSILSALISLYLALGIKEPSIFLQPIFYGVLFIVMLSYLQKVQKQANDKRILKEKLVEEINLIREEMLKKETLKTALEGKVDRFLNLHKATGELKGGQELHEMAQKIVREVKEALGKAEECVLYLVNEAREGLSLVASTRKGGEVVREKEGSVFDQWVMKKSQGLMIEDTQNDFRFSGETRTNLSHLRSVCVSPLITEKKVLGVMRAGARAAGVFSADDLRLLDIYSSLAAVNLRNVLLYEKMGELAIKDSLTGLYLNRYFQERLLEEIQRANLNHLYFSLILLDIDFFKRCNDEYGHAAGDIVLKNVATIISRCLDPADFVARYGGEEFVVLLPNQRKKQALQTAEKIRSEIDKNKFSFRRVESHVTASLGVVTFPEAGRTKEELIRTADKNLYGAKHAGRNRVCGNI